MWHTRGGACVRAQVRFLVLDEADKLFDLGFVQQVRRAVPLWRVLQRQGCAPWGPCWRCAVRQRCVAFAGVLLLAWPPPAGQIDAVIHACSHPGISRSLFSATLPDLVEQLAR